MKDRYYGVNDPVADKMLARAAERPKMTPPADVGICTLYCGGIGPEVVEQDVRDTFYAFGEIRRCVFDP